MEESDRVGDSRWRTDLQQNADTQKGSEKKPGLCVSASLHAQRLAEEQLFLIRLLSYYYVRLIFATFDDDIHLADQMRGDI
jgi:hypothetical protein